MWIIVWIASIIVTVAVAEAKGRGGIGWFIAAVLFGPLSALIIICLPADHKMLETNSLFDGTSKKCPHCAEIIKREANVCRYCGRDVETNQAPQSQTIEVTDAIRKTQI